MQHEPHDHKKKINKGRHVVMKPSQAFGLASGKERLKGKQPRRKESERKKIKDKKMKE